MTIHVDPKITLDPPDLRKIADVLDGVSNAGGSLRSVTVDVWGKRVTARTDKWGSLLITKIEPEPESG